MNQFETGENNLSIAEIAVGAALFCAICMLIMAAC